MNQKCFRARSSLVFIPVIILLLGLFYLLSLYNYLLFHTLIEFSGVIIAITIFVIGWNTRKYAKSNMFIILATGYLVVGSIGLLHTITFRGMGIFPQYDSNIPTQFWIAARYVEGIAFFLAALYLGRKTLIRPEAWLYGFLTAGAVLVYTIFSGIFPDSFVEGEGLTTFKVVSEYLIAAIFMVAGIVFWKKRTYLGRNILSLLLLAGVFTILSELSFTLYVDVYGFFNFLGHIFMLFSLAFIYRALIYESLTNPFQVLFREIAEVNEKLTHSEKKYRDLVEQSADWVWAVDHEGKLTYSNQRVEEITGYELEEILGKNVFDFMDPEAAVNNNKYFLDLVARREFFYQYETTMLHKDGRPIVFETSGAPIIDERGELKGYRGIGRDITERKKAEQKLKQARDEAEQANQVKSNFLANMSHEIRTPMNVIIGITDILYSSGLTPEQKEWASMVREASASLQAIINNLLDFSKAEAGKLELAQNHFNLPREVEKIVSSFSQQAREKGLRLSCSVDDNVPETVTGDAARLRQVLVNLLVNGIKFTERGEVSVHLGLDKAAEGASSGQKPGQNTATRVLFTVSDTGIGIPSDKLDQVFQGFTQVDQYRPRRYEGTGLGLAISKKLVELMGGSIWVKSVEKKGSTFYFTIPFTLPRDTGAETEASASAKPAALPPTETKEETTEQPSEQPSGWEEKALQVLLVEDKAMNQKLATVLLEKKGHQVTVANNGQQALEKLQAGWFDLVIMDIHMPDMDGLEATTHIRAAEKGKNGRTPIIAMTAYTMEEDKEKCLQAGMDYYLSKPLHAQELYYALDSIMEKKLDKAEQHDFSPGELQEMLQQVDGNRELLQELLEIFLQDYYQDMVIIKEALVNEDAQALAVTAHGLKGELGNLGMRSAYKIACELETLAKENNLEKAVSLPVVLEYEIMRLKHFFANSGGQEQQ